MIDVSSGDEKLPLAALHLDVPRDGEPLRQCVREALESYFAHLGEHSPCGLYRMVLSEVEPPLLESVMRYTRGNQSRAAALLGLNRGTLRKKLRQYNLE